MPSLPRDVMPRRASAQSMPIDGRSMHKMSRGARAPPPPPPRRSGRGSDFKTIGEEMLDEQDGVTFDASKVETMIVKNGRLELTVERYGHPMSHPSSLLACAVYGHPMSHPSSLLAMSHPSSLLACAVHVCIYIYN